MRHRSARPHEHREREYAALLIAKAAADRQAAHALAEAGVAAEMIGFHAQQAVGKATNALLVLAGVPVPRTHDLARLLEVAVEAGCPAPRGVADAAWLTPWGVQFRYDEVVEALDEDAALGTADAAIRCAVATTVAQQAGAARLGGALSPKRCRAA